jgi:hypothetical protein
MEGTSNCAGGAARQEEEDMLVMRKIERFLRQNAIAPTTFGRLAVGDPRLIHDMRRGRMFRASMIRRVENFMITYQADQQNMDVGSSK